MSVKYGSAYTVPRADLGEAMMEYMYDESNLIGDKLYPIFESSKKKGALPKILKAGMLRRNKTKRAPGGNYSRSDFEADEFEFSCQEYGHEAKLPHDLREFYASDFDAEEQSAQHAMWQVRLDHESRVATLATDGTTTYTVANGRRTDVATAWSDVAAPIIKNVTDAMETVRQRTGKNPNTLAFGAGVLPYMISNTEIRASIQPTQLPSRKAILEALAALFGLEQILVGGQVENTADEGLAATIADIWGSGWAIVANTARQGAGILEPCVGRTILWVNDSPDAVMVEQYEEPQTRSTIFRSRQHTDELEFDADQQQLLDIAG